MFTSYVGARKNFYALVALTGLLGLGTLSNATGALSLVGQPTNFDEYLDWESLEAGGLDATQLTSGEGQSFKLGSLGGAFEDVKLTVRVMMSGTGSVVIRNNAALQNRQGILITLPEGQSATIRYSFSTPLLMRHFAGGSVDATERIGYSSNGTAINPGSLANQSDLSKVGLTVSDDDIFNETDSTIIAGQGIIWNANVDATTYTAFFQNATTPSSIRTDDVATVFTVSVGTSGVTPVPEPSSALLITLSAVITILRRQR